MSLDGVGLTDLLARGETDNVEFKSGVPEPRSVARVLAALANTQGGYLVFGANDGGRPVGVDPDAAADVIKKAKLLLVPHPNVVVDRHVLSGRTLVVVEVGRSASAIALEGRVFTRIGAGIAPIRASAAREVSLPVPHDGMTPEEKGELLANYVAARAKVGGLDFSRCRLRVGVDLTGARRPPAPPPSRPPRRPPLAGSAQLTENASSGACVDGSARPGDTSAGPPCRLGPRRCPTAPT